MSEETDKAVLAAVADLKSSLEQTQAMLLGVEVLLSAVVAAERMSRADGKAWLALIQRTTSSAMGSENENPIAAAAAKFVSTTLKSIEGNAQVNPKSKH